MRHPLDGAIIRAWRGEEHINDLECRIDELVASQSNAALDKLDFDTLSPSHEFIREGRRLGNDDSLQLDMIPTPLIYPVIIGEICYNLRSALDSLVYELAINDSGQPQEGTHFPIEDSPEGFRIREDPTAGPRCHLRGVNAPHIAAIERLQPYNGCDWTKTLRSISNPDKHGPLTTTVSHRVGFVKFFTTPPLDTSEGPVRRARCRGVEVYVQHPVFVAVLFADGSGVVKTLRLLQSRVAETLESFQPDFR